MNKNTENLEKMQNCSTKPQVKNKAGKKENFTGEQSAKYPGDFSASSTVKNAGFSSVSINFQLKQTGIALKKELFAAFLSPAVYIAVLLFIIAPSINYFFAGQFFIAGKATSDLRNFYNFFPYICILIIPVLTMHLWAAEINGLVFALPLSTSALVLGKWLCSLIILVMCQIFLLLVPVCVNRFGAVDWGQIFAANFVILFYFAAVCALGQFFSLVTKSQVTAAILCTIVLALINCVHLVPLYFSNAKTAAKLANAVSFAWHFDAASKGILDSRDIFFYSICTAAFLLASVFLIEWRKEKT